MSEAAFAWCAGTENKGLENDPMKVTVDSDKLSITRGKLFVFLSTLAVIAGLFAFGVLFVSLGKDGGAGAFFMAVFGWFFVGVGMLALFTFGRYLLGLRNQSAITLLQADHEGLTLAPLTGMTPALYPWSAIDHIILTRKLVNRGTSETGYSWNQGVIYLREPATDLGLVERGRRQIWKSPKGQNLIQVDVPKHAMSRIQAELARLSGMKVPVSLASRLLLDYAEDEELLEV
jgi:hypothetical protein